MTTEQKTEILRARLNGATIREAAKMLDGGPSFQAVAQFITQLDPNKQFAADLSEPVPRPRFATEAQEEAVLEGLAIYRGNIPAVISHVRAATGESVDYELVTSAIAYITARHKAVNYAGHYIALENYLRDNCMAAQKLEQAAGLSAGKLSNILHNRAHLDLETAKRLKATTGLSLQEIYTQDMSAIRAASCAQEPEVQEEGKEYA